MSPKSRIPYLLKIFNPNVKLTLLIFYIKKLFKTLCFELVFSAFGTGRSMLVIFGTQAAEEKARRRAGC